ncbi:hypothetical protein FOH10_09110 [Nocardia otitidiscaviarum]|uniref:Uncharacterized protein n=1 Tax=Nocardia otitidiscaviarum TaxID=1823 RepID=A0A516NJ06_9NOCA|nr:hypothetical protein [Nocardia otitidiscaviarum]MCP9619685.1 hypothetical protein [Nocardia otitidiscaviarum]QDP78872.1 hypothetical protein FOH10_09110 [Nocardia otitidiscaviarum]
MNGVVHLRLSGELADITAVLANLVGSHAFRLDVNPRTYLNRGGGVRVYADISIPEQEIPR